MKQHARKMERDRDEARSTIDQTGTPKHSYNLKIFNGRVKVYVDEFVMFCFNQIDFKGYYAYKDDTSLYGIDIYLVESSGGSGGSTTMEVYFKTKENWMGVLKLLDDNL